MRRIHNILTLLLASMLLIGAVSPTITTSQTPSAEATPPSEVDAGPRFVLRPQDGADGSYFTINAKPGTSTQVVAVLGNAGTQSIDLRTFSSDAVTLVNGGFGVKEEDEERTGPTTWIDWSAETFTFDPGQGIERSFTVAVPEDAEPGQYISGLTLQTAEPLEIEGSTMFNQIIRKTVAVFIIIEGETEAAFGVGQPEIVTSQSGSRLEIPVSNFGDVLVKPSGTVSLVNADGTEVFRADIAMGSVYARLNDTLLAVPLESSLAGQDYELSVHLQDEASGVEASIEAEQITFSGEIPEESPMQLAQASIIPMPDADDPIYANVHLIISNTGESLTNATVVLHVYRNDDLVEEFVLGTKMTIAQGETTISQRYVPAEGFMGGEWTFSISIETVTPQSNATTVMLEESLPDTITLP